MSAPRRVVYQDRESWLASRRLGIGASEVAAVLGLHPYKSAFAVWVEKQGGMCACGHVSRVHEPDGHHRCLAPACVCDEFLEALTEEQAEAATWGTLFEPVVRAEVARRIGRRIFVPDCPPGGYVTYYSEVLEKSGVPLFVTPDGQIDRAYVPELVNGQPVEAGSGCPTRALRPMVQVQGFVPYPPAKVPVPCLRPAGHPLVQDVDGGGHIFDLVDPRGPGLYEGKVAGLFVDADEWRDEGPTQHLVQVQAGLAVLGWSWGLLAGVIGGQRARLHEVARDDGFIAWMLEQLRVFWQEYVVPGVPPPVDGSGSTKDALASYYARAADGVTVELPEAAKLWAAERAQGKREIKAAEARVQEAENRIKAAIGEAVAGKFQDGSGFRWPVIVPVGKARCPHCAETLPAASPHRRLSAIGERRGTRD